MFFKSHTHGGLVGAIAVAAAAVGGFAVNPGRPGWVPFRDRHLGRKRCCAPRRRMRPGWQWPATDSRSRPAS
jgi:hypothetical protein